MNLCIFTVFLKNKNIIFKIRRSKVTDYAALKVGLPVGFLLLWYSVLFTVESLSLLYLLFIS